MKYSLASLLSFALAVPAAVISSSSPQPPCRYPIGKPGSFAKPARRLFNLDGKVQYFAGSNAWWLGHLSNNADVDIALKQVAATGYKVLRVWGFGDGMLIYARLFLAIP